MTLLSETRTDAFPVDGGTPPDRPSHSPATPDVESLAARFEAVRSASVAFCDPLVTEDYVIQTMPDVSPTKWHLAHTAWFFETFLLRAHLPGYEPADEAYAYLFNSYYVSVGDRHCRQARGSISRPTVADVMAYRAAVDAAMRTLLGHMAADADLAAELSPLVEVGLQHEQQHQELMATDLKHVFASNPTYPVYMPEPAAPRRAEPVRWLRVGEGVRRVGHGGGGCGGFAYDNESPRHRVFVEPFELAHRPVTNGEFLAFVEDGGYDTPGLWLSAGWAAVGADRANWSAPMYWDRVDGEWVQFTMSGMRPLDLHEPVHHVSYYEADAFARWVGGGARLPTEFEWEVACDELPHTPASDAGGDDRFHPRLRAAPDGGAAGLIGGVWEWTQSQYTAYPGYRPPAGALGEYNGKFMADQFVLRGGSCATPPGHARPTYRNFFPAAARWQYAGLRLARSV